ncbi:MAG: prepilin-type N-terminal cleavage/methylation domain-containing protein [Patescibacteria group bacterium]|jgi:type II secretion system protein G
MRKYQKGFTLVEMLVTIAVIGILAAVGLALLPDLRDKGRIADAQGDVRTLATAIRILEFDTGLWPGAQTPVTHQGVDGNEVWDLSTDVAGIVATDGSFSNWQGPYVPFLPVDPWGNPYFLDTDYDVDPSAGEQWEAVIGSFGPNGIAQNVYNDDNNAGPGGSDIELDDVYIIISPSS